MREAALTGVSRRRGPVTTRRDQEARRAPDLVEGWYNPGRRHSALGYLSPIAYEMKMTSES